MKLGFLYAGQGSQHPGMGKDLYAAYPAFRHVMDNAPVDFDLTRTCFEDPNEVLGQTRYTQPCMVAFALGVTDILAELGVYPSVAAGLSLGEYSALYAAGVLDAKAAIETVNFRGKAMEQAASGRDCAMIAVLGLDRAPLQAACDSASNRGVVMIANDNCPGQLVLGGERAAVEQAAALAKEAGARRCMPLRVSGPFHTPFMKPAGDALADFFRNIHFATPNIPVIFNCLGDVNKQNIPIPALLVRQVQSGVRMTESIRTMERLGVDAIIEIGPGKVLSGFVRKTLSGIPVYSVETVSDLEQLPQFLEGVETKHEKP